MISVVVPLFNEGENLRELISRLDAALEGRHYEFMLVDDGSSDDTREQLAKLANRRPEIKVLSLSRNFGHQAAITAGLEHASGDAVVVMDGDLQDPPEAIPGLISRWFEGYDVVYAVRRNRKEGPLKRAAYSGFYRLLKRLSYLDIPLDSGDFALMDRRVVDLLNHLPERNRFVRGIRSWVGFRQVGMEVEREARAAGDPKYTVKMLRRLAFDGIISFSHAPLRIFSSLGLVFSVGSFLSILVVLWIRLFTDMSVPGFASTATLILLLGGVQLLGIGILGEYIARIFDEVKNRPNYIVAERSNLDADTHLVAKRVNLDADIPK
ncbi:MAG: glycosyltransferase family 2 protein [Deltaproteobacteria bacterium]|nr:glycosyltransferase family 2 protein [Deltaproteobacteria bacterium]